MFESYQAKLAIAKRLGEIAVMARAVGAGAPPVLASGATADPRSNYNPALSADGRWVAFESALGNLNFAKRYGRMEVLARDLRSGRTIKVSHPPELTISRSAYNPTISGDGRLIAYEAYDRPDEPGGGTRVVRARPAQRPRARRARAARHVRRALRAAAVGRRPPARLQRARARRRDALGGLRPRPAQRPHAPRVGGGRGGVGAGALRARHGRRLHRRGRRAASRTWSSATSRAARRAAIASPAGSGLAFEPSLSSSGRRVAFVARPGGTRQTQVFVHDLRTRRTQLVSRADGRDGPPGMGSASHPAISGDGRRVAFTSEAWNLSPQKCNSARGIFVRDLARATTRPASAGDGGNRYLGPTKGSSTRSDAFITLLCA